MHTPTRAGHSGGGAAGHCGSSCCCLCTVAHDITRVHRFLARLRLNLRAPGALDAGVLADGGVDVLKAVVVQTRADETRIELLVPLAGSSKGWRRAARRLYRRAQLWTGDFLMHFCIERE